MTNWKFNESQFNIACTSSLLLYMIIANTIFDPKCYSPESQLQEQNKQVRTFPVLYTVAWLHSTEPQTTQNDIMITQPNMIIHSEDGHKYDVQWLIKTIQTTQHVITSDQLNKTGAELGPAQPQLVSDNWHIDNISYLIVTWWLLGR